MEDGKRNILIDAVEAVVESPEMMANPGLLTEKYKRKDNGGIVPDDY